MIGIDRSELIALTERLVAAPSEKPPGKEAGVAEVLVDRLEATPVPSTIELDEVAPDRLNVIGGLAIQPTDHWD